MIRYKTLLFVLLAGLALFVPVTALSPSARAQGDTAIVHPDVRLEVGQGQVETLKIIIENAHDVYGIDLRAEFDPSVVEIADGIPDQEGVQMIPGDFIKPDFVVRNTVDNQKGTLQYVVTQTNPTPPATGTGVVLLIPVRGKTLGKQTTLKISFVAIADRKGVKMSVSAGSGTLVVVPPKPATATATSNATATATKTPSPIATAPATAAPVATAVSAAPPAPPENRLLTAALIVVAGGGCLGTLVLLGVAAFLLLRRPARRNLPSQ
ncbi:MAG: cohesin domain-containing protein [Anaerolineae bacterium]